MGTELHNLQPPAGARKKKKRIGRGPGSGNGKTAGRGSKGTKKRNNVMMGFEGGQLPIHRRVPKRGFVNIHRVEVHSVNVSRLEAVLDAGATIGIDELRNLGLIPKKATIVKVLGDGEISKKLTLKVHRVSATAREKIEKAGGTIEIVPVREPKAST
jgi:large subunit ribosomal protein L15